MQDDVEDRRVARAARPERARRAARARRGRPGAARDPRPAAAAGGAAAARRGAVDRARSRVPGVQRVLSLVTLTGVAGRPRSCCWRGPTATGPQVVQLGGWAAPAGISLVADRLSTLLLVVSQRGAARGARVRRSGRASPTARRTPLAVFHPCYLVLAAGIALAFLTGDLFNLFVAFEVMLVASYVLHHAGRRRRAGARRHDLRRGQPAGVGAVRDGRRAGLRRDRHGQHGRRRAAAAGRAARGCGSRSG